MGGKAHYISLNVGSSSYFLFYTGTVLFRTSVGKNDCNCEISVTKQLLERVFYILKSYVMVPPGEGAI